MNHLIPSPRAGTWQALALFFVFVCSFSVPRASGQGTAFTYQGRLTDNGNPANGAYDLVASLFAASSGGNAAAGPVTNSPVNVSNGLFSIALDFGGNFPEADRWLEIGARAAGVGDFVPLAPRQKITSAPYAVTARNVTGVLPSAGLTGTYSGAVTFNNSANAFTGNGSGLSGVNAISLGGLSAIQFWRTGGNSGTSPNTC